MPLLVMLSGCGAGNLFGLGKDSMHTASINPLTEKGDKTELWSDEITIRNAVSSANLIEIGEGRLSWANADTGSQGAISDLREYKDDGVRCRRFIASRESFDGVTLYKGEACLQNSGMWIMRDFEPARA